VPTHRQDGGDRDDDGPGRAAHRDARAAHGDARDTHAGTPDSHAGTPETTRRAQASMRQAHAPSRRAHGAMRRAHAPSLLARLRAEWPALAAFVAAFCCVFGWAVFRGHYLIGGDVFFYTYPLRAAAFRMIREGTPPVWTPHVLSGFPLLAMPQLGLAYPLTWGHLFLPPRLAEQLYIFAPFLLAPAFTYFFCRELRRTRTASVLAALAFAYGGLTTNGFGMNGLMPNAVMWLPLFLIAVERARTRPFARCLLGAASAYSMSVLTGFAQGFTLVALVALAYALFLSLFAHDPAPADDAVEAPTRRPVTEATSESLEASETPRGAHDESARLSTRPSTRLSARPSARPSARLSARLSTGLSARGPFASWARWRPCVVALAAVALAAGVGAFQILETLRAQRRSIRSHVSFEFFKEGAFAPLEALRSFAAPPYHFIEVTANVAPLAFLLALLAVCLAARRLRTPATSARVSTKASVSTRASGSMRARVSTKARSRFRPDARVLFWAALAAVAFLLMLGDATPLARWLHRVPLLGQMRRPSRHAFEWTFAVAVLSAYGLDSLCVWARLRLSRLRELARARLGGPALAALAAALIFACAWLAESWHAVARGYPHGPGAAAAAEGVYLRWKLAFVCCALVALAACLLVASRRLRAPLLAALVLASSLAEPHILISLWWPGTIKTAARLMTPAQTTRLLQSLPPAENRAYVRANSAVEEPASDPRFDALDLTALHGLHNVAGYEPLLQARYGRALGDVDFDAVTPRRDPAGNLSLFATRSHVLDLLNATHVVTFADLHARQEDRTPLPPEFAGGTRALDPARWQTVAEFDGVVLLRNLRAFPRAWLVAEAVAVDGEEALKTIRGEPTRGGSETARVAGEAGQGGAETARGDERAERGRAERGAASSVEAREFDPRRTALVEVRPGELPPLPGGEVAAGSAARVVGYEANSLTVETDAPTATLLVVSEMFYPGWEASVDGNVQPILLTNYLLRGVAVPAGKHRVEMRYAATAARNGAIISGLCLVALLALAVVSGRRARAGES
jgi:Bacterial membrane protein YfhO